MLKPQLQGRTDYCIFLQKLHDSSHSDIIDWNPLFQTRLINSKAMNTTNVKSEWTLANWCPVPFLPSSRFQRQSLHWVQSFAFISLRFCTGNLWQKCEQILIYSLLQLNNKSIPKCLRGLRTLTTRENWTSHSAY